MANLLLNPANWTDDSDTSPPACWTGTAYRFQVPFPLTLTATAVAGDILHGTFAGTAYGQGHQVAINVNGTDAIDWASDSDSLPGTINIALAAGDAVEIVSMLDTGEDVLDFTLTPAPPPAQPCKRLQFEVAMTGDDEDAG